MRTLSSLFANVAAVAFVTLPLDIVWLFVARTF